ncbi:Castor and Pollux protein voltage-gated ion channel component [Kribbella voronezhensis]|uniref:Castor and Pollux protein voltage-gated ion channel component n=1 Tax=Kribbella voronezhensis TaxID=2512212 RepID=A0A4R7T816_9ACTN|nr:potassium transporter TrkA [Kribbella voronezhensis]TDU88031.1 Castor and Pollux protein voltage-gated ion channel component [Kribbella voronezhensis]
MWRDRARYWFDSTMSRGTPALIGWLGLASALLVLATSGLLLVLAPTDAKGHGGWHGVLWMSLLRTLDPGTMGGDQGGLFFLALMLAVTLGGIFIVSSFIGVLTTGLENKITVLRKGRSRIVEQDHTVVLGWSEQIFTVVSELAQANQTNRRSCVAILADRDKVEMEDAIRARVPDLGRTQVVCRTGNPLRPADLDLVALRSARSVMVLPPDTDDADIQVIKVLLSLGSRATEADGPRVVAAVADSANLPAAQLAGGPRAQLIGADDLAVRLLVNAHRQSGLSAVCADLLAFAGNEFYLKTEPSLSGSTFAAAVHAYELGVPVGLRHGDDSIELNPPGDFPIRDGDELIVLAEDDTMIRLAQTPPRVVEHAIAPPTDRPPAPTRTLMIGWNKRAPQILELLDAFAYTGSVLRIAGPEPIADQFGGYPNLAVTTTICEPTNRAQLEALDVTGYQHLIVLAADDLGVQEADARTLVTLLHLRDLARSLEIPYSIVSEINDDANREIAEVTRADDFVVSDKLISLLLTQLTENRHLAKVFEDLFNPTGAEIYLKPATDYLRPDTDATFATIVEAARRLGETAIGYRVHDEFYRPPAYGVVLNPPKNAPVTLTALDRVVVLAEN